MFHYLTNTLDPLTLDDDCVIIDHHSYSQADREVTLRPGVKKCIYFSLVESATTTITFHVQSPGVHLQIYGVALATSEQASTGHVHLRVEANDVRATMHLMSLVQEGVRIAHRGTIDIAPHHTGIQTHLLEEHILLGDNIRVIAQPELHVASHDVQASHGAKIERVDEESLLYMTSRGLSRPQAQQLIIQGYLQHIADQLAPSCTPAQQEQLSSLIADVQAKLV